MRHVLLLLGVQSFALATPAPLFDAGPAVSDIQSFVPVVMTFLVVCLGVLIASTVVWVIVSSVRNR